MSIHFAAAKPAGLTATSSPGAKILVARAQKRVANDNADFAERSQNNDRVMRAALRHFATHGMGAAKVAREQAEKAFFKGDRDTYDWWVDITRTLDRRVAASVSGQTEPLSSTPGPGAR
ncbi:hypothetical protein EH31_03615 [Erythrobacter longus]|uniref:Uncharacterized protein n=1 Tax=Erythrobacter longus TaxID=1044 RepID=A0A074MAD4_ERYLO|nr:hypothetical protein [Erythrobacter longus]KEO91771.1 hypothetical protein EH31_03615 [Erythrobacter longus]